MIVSSRRYGRLRGFGMASPVTGADCPVPGGSGVFGFLDQSKVNSWCDCAFPASQRPDLNLKCKDTGLTKPGYPWTDVGAAVRGLPKPGSIIVSAINTISGGGGGGAATPSTPPTASDVSATIDKWSSNAGGGTSYQPDSGMPSWGVPAIIGAVVLGGAFFFSRSSSRSSSMSGYRRRRARR